MRKAMIAAVAGLVFACAPGSDEPAEHEPHDEMPEAMAPLTQSAEDGPVAEGVYRAPDFETFMTAEGFAVGPKIPLPAVASRATIWVTLSGATDATPIVFVQAGWSNGQRGPFVPMAEIGSVGAERVLAVDLETAATSLTLRVAADALDRVKTLRWSASVPLEPGLRSSALADVEPVVDSVVTARSTWSALAARCGPNDVAPTTIVLRAEETPADEVAAMRALQLRDRDGLGWCDLRPSYVVGATQVFMGRGTRRAAAEATAEANAGRVAVSVLGCAPSGATEANLFAALDELVRRFSITSADDVVVMASPVCADVTGLEDAKARWIATDPFDAMPPPPPPPPPPPTMGTIEGVVEDGSMPGTPIEGAQVMCACGASTTTGVDGRFTLETPVGAQALVVTKMGFDAANAAVEVMGGATSNVTVTMTLEVVMNPGVSVIDHAYLIDRWGGVNADPTMFPETQDGFQAYLDAVGVTYFAAWEYVVPNNATVAANCGYTILLPDRSMWPRAAALGLLADQLRSLVNEPVTLRNWWRPPCYNEGVGGAANGDHPDGDALDLDFRSATSRAAAQQYLCDTFWSQDLVAPEDIAPGSGLNPRLNMSVGLGGVTIHLGLLSRNGRRFWKYASYTQEPSSGSCW